MIVCETSDLLTWNVVFPTQKLREEDLKRMKGDRASQQKYLKVRWSCGFYW